MNAEEREFYSKALLINYFLTQGGDYRHSTRKMSKLKKHNKQGISAAVKRFGKEFVDLSEETDAAYLKALKSIPEGKHLNVLLSQAMWILNDTLASNKYKDKWYSPKTFNEGVGSLEHGAAGMPNENEDSWWLVDEFMKNMGYPRESAFAKKIRLAKKIKEQNDILEGKS